MDDALLVLEEIGNNIVAAIAAEIETGRRTSPYSPPARLTPESYHRGCGTCSATSRRTTSVLATSSNRRSSSIPLSRGPTPASPSPISVARSSGWEEREPQIELAYAAAANGLLADERDPAVHWAMGRALYLRRRWDECEAELVRSVELSPQLRAGSLQPFLPSLRCRQPHRRHRRRRPLPQAQSL